MLRVLIATATLLAPALPASAGLLDAEPGTFGVASSASGNPEGIKRDRRSRGVESQAGTHPEG